MNPTISRAPALDRPALDDLVQRGFTRRALLRVAALLGAGAALPFDSEHALAQLSDVGRIPDDAVKINANKFPEGPSERALAALAVVAKNGNFDAHGFTYTASVSNKLMVDARLPTQQVIDGLKQRKVYVGRPWPVWPLHVRVSLGLRADMDRFRSAFLEITAARR